MSRLRTVLRSVASAAVVLSGLALPATPASAGTTAANSVAITVDSVTPLVPTPTTTHTPLTFALTITNRTNAPLTNVHILAERDEPIQTQSQLDSAIASGQPMPSSIPIFTAKPLTLNLGPREVVTKVFTTSTSIPDDGKGLCLCAKAAVYPLFFSAHTTDANGVDQSLGYARTFLPTSFGKPAKVQVGWLWPLIDRPHRLTKDDVFTDDTLAASVATGGRLARALDVVQSVENASTPDVPITLLVDPELIDELAVMATGKYTVRSGSAAKAGTGASAAAAWLAELHDLVATPSVDVQFTPYADPNVETLTRQGLSWSSTLPAAVAKRIADVLGPLPPATLTWPVGSALGANTLRALVKDGTSTVVLDSRAVTPASGLNGLARLSVGGTDVAALLTSASIEKYAADALTVGGQGRAALPQLISEVAIRAIQEPDVPHSLLIAAPRYVDPADGADKIIEYVSSSLFTTTTNAATMVSGALLPTGRSQLGKAPVTPPALSDSTLTSVTSVTHELPALTSMIETRNDPDAQTFLAGLPVGVQRLESSGWSGTGAATAGDQLGGDLVQQVANTLNGVHIVRPASGTYTLASSNSPLPITVENDLPYAVKVRIAVQAANNGPDFKASSIGVQSIDANSKRTLHLPTSVERTGRIRVQAQLSAPNGTPLGAQLDLTIRSTALGIVGVIITIVAGVVLALALIVRFVRRLRHRRATGPDPTEPNPTGVPA